MSKLVHKPDLCHFHTKATIDLGSWCPPILSRCPVRAPAAIRQHLSLSRRSRHKISPRPPKMQHTKKGAATTSAKGG